MKILKDIISSFKKPTEGKRFSNNYKADPCCTVAVIDDNKQISSLEEKIKQIANESKFQQQQLLLSMSEQGRLTQQLQSKDADIKNLKSQLQLNQHEKVNYETNIMTLEEENSTLKSQLQIVKNENSSLHKEIFELKSSGNEKLSRKFPLLSELINNYKYTT